MNILVRPLLCFGWLLLLVAGARAASPPEWLKPIIAADTTALAPAHGAVGLVESETVRYVTDDRIRRLRRGAIRVLAADGRSAAKCAYAYNANTEKIITARAWIVSADGKRAEVLATAKFADTAAKFGNFFSAQDRILSCDDDDRTELKGVFAWEFEVESQAGIFDVNWGFGTRLAMARSTLEVTPPPGGKLEWHASDAHIPAPVPAGAAGAMRWEMQNLPAISGEEPDRFLPAPRSVSVRAVTAGRGRVATWPDMARTAAEIIEPRIAISAEIKQLAQSLTANRTTRWDRIRAVTEFVQREIVYLSLTLDKDYLAGYRPQPAPEVLKNRYGDCKDKTALLVALLRALGEEASPVLVFSGNPQAVQRNWPSASFNHVITAIAADDAVPADWPIVEAGPQDRVVLFDATDSTTPLGFLSLGDQGGLGLVVSTKTSDLIALPVVAAENNRFECTMRATLDARGVLRTRVEENARGAIAVAKRASRDSLRDRYGTALEARVHETLPLARNLQWSDAWDAAAAQWKLEYAFDVAGFGRMTGGSLMIVNPQVLPLRARLGAWKTTQDGVVWSIPASLKREVRLTLPAESTVEELPDDWKQESPIATCALRYRKEGGEVVFDYEFTQRGGYLNKADYEALRAFVQKTLDAERRPVLLRNAPASTAK